MRTLFSWSLWALGQALGLPLEGVGVGTSDRAILAELGTDSSPSSVWLMPFSLPIPFCSRVHTLGSGIYEACFSESRTATQADLASTSVGCDPQYLCPTWATNPCHSGTKSSELRYWGQIKAGHLGKAGILSVPVAYLIATGVLSGISILHTDLTVSACLFPSRRTLEPGAVTSSAGKLTPWKVVTLPDTEVTFGSSHGSCCLLLLILQG